MLSPAEVARLAGLSRSAVYRAIERGEVVASRLCGRLRVDRGEFEIWKARQRVRPRQPASPMLRPLGPVPPEGSGTFLNQLRKRTG
jgi:excisionase family DNA binding protein